MLSPRSRPALLPRRLLLLALLGLSGATVFAAADTPVPSEPKEEAPKNYTDRGRTTTDITVQRDFSHDPFSRRFGSTRHDNFSARVTVDYQPIYFPPTPPALGEPIPANTTRASLAKFAAPAVLASYVYEPFYAPLSPLLFAENLDRKRREKLHRYHAARTAALAALRAKLDELPPTAPAARPPALAAFAIEQAAALAALEAMAEELRANFVNGGLFQTGNDWNESREWRLGDNTRWESAVDEIKVVTGAAFFQKGLAPAQRRLLREMAMELADSLRAPGADISLDAPGPFLYFAPEMARIRLPADLPAGLTEKIAAYQNQKTVLKSELRDILYREDRAFFDYKRSAALTALAEQQGPRLAALEQLAEEIRVGLAPLPNPARPAALPLPPALADRLATYLAQKSAWLRTMRARLEATRAEFPEDRVEYARQSASLVIQIVPNRRSSAATNVKRAVVLASLATFNAEQSRRYADLVRDKESLRAEVQKVARSAPGPATSRSIDGLLQQFAFAFDQQERWERYHDYELAVLQPGLSAAQRRLLFGAAIEKLDLPLGPEL